MSEKKTIRISIFDKSYVITTDENELKIQKAARIVDGLLREISSKIQANNEGKVAVLAALKLAIDLLEKEQAQDDVELSIEHLIECINKASVIIS